MARALTRSQHLAPERKYLLRKRVLRWVRDCEGPAYCPFIGDGDIAAGGEKSGALDHEKWGYPGLYTDRFVYGADLDEQRVTVARARIPNGLIIVSDCDLWPFGDDDCQPFVVADFDAWNEPYGSFRSFWKYAPKADRMALFFTDAHRLGIMADGTHIRPDGTKYQIANLTERRATYFFYLSKHVWPWFDETIRPYRVLERYRYNRGMLTYWGAAVEKPRATGRSHRS